MAPDDTRWAEMGRQFEQRQGPCWEAPAVDSDLVRTDDLSRERRWGSFGATCAALDGLLVLTLLLLAA